jgi:hypothetical protein
MADFFSFWYQGKLTPIEQLCLTSFISKGHKLDLYSYDTVEVPKGVVLKDASEIFPKDQVFFYKRGPGSGSISAFSNVFRYKVLYERGGWWTDTDVICLSENVPHQEICFAYEEADLINGALLKIPARHKFAEVLLREAQNKGTDFLWGECGPELITETVNSLSLQEDALPKRAFYPIHYTNALDVLLPDRFDAVSDATSGSYFIHLWNEIFRQTGILKTAAPPVGSYLWEKFSEHGIDFSSVAQYSDETIRRLLYQSQLIERRGQELVESRHRYRESIENLRNRLDNRVQQLSNIKARHRQTSARLRQKNGQLAAFKRSRSWRVTRPFRMMRRIVTSQLITLRRITPYLAQKGK